MSWLTNIQFIDNILQSIICIYDRTLIWSCIISYLYLTLSYFIAFKHHLQQCNTFRERSLFSFLFSLTLTLCAKIIQQWLTKSHAFDKFEETQGCILISQPCFNPLFISFHRLSLSYSIVVLLLLLNQFWSWSAIWRLVIEWLMLFQTLSLSF